MARLSISLKNRNVINKNYYRVGFLHFIKFYMRLLVSKPFSHCLFGVSANRLNEYISHYEEASYSREDVAQAHHRAKRSLSDPSKNLHVQISFRAHGKSFRLRLKRDTETFSHGLQVVDSENRPVTHSVSHIYQGHLIGECLCSLYVPIQTTDSAPFFRVHLDPGT